MDFSQLARQSCNGVQINASLFINNVIFLATLPNAVHIALFPAKLDAPMMNSLQNGLPCRRETGLTGAALLISWT